jgi:hypothetical protein
VKRSTISLAFGRTLAREHPRQQLSCFCECTCLTVTIRSASPAVVPSGTLILFCRKEMSIYGASRARSSAVEHLTFNQVVVGSIPTGLTSNFSNLLVTLIRCNATRGYPGAIPGRPVEGQMQLRPVADARYGAGVRSLSRRRETSPTTTKGAQ